METVSRNVGDLDRSERSALERLVGHALQENQRLVIQVMTLDVTAGSPATAGDQSLLPDWCNVYEGLSDAEISDLDEAISRRLDLTRPSA